MMFAGQRPGVSGCVSSVGSAAIRHPSTLIPPVPHFSTFAATVPSRGLRAHTIGSQDGFRAVPHPAHWRAASVAGAVMLNNPPPLNPLAPKDFMPALLPHWPSPTTSRSAPAAESIALLTSSDFGKPLLPVTKTFPFRRATKAPESTRMHHTLPR